MADIIVRIMLPLSSHYDGGEAQDGYCVIALCVFLFPHVQGVRAGGRRFEVGVWSVKGA